MESLNFKVVTAGTKMIASTPEIRVTSAINHFVLNSVAVDTLGIEEGDKVLMLQMPNEDPDSRFFIAVAEGDEKSALLGKTGSSLHFNYSGIYGAMFINDAERAIVGVKELLSKGVFENFITPQGNKVARGLMTVDYTLEPVGEHEINEVVRPVFALTNRVENALQVKGGTVLNNDAEEIVEAEA